MFNVGCFKIPQYHFKYLNFSQTAISLVLAIPCKCKILFDNRSKQILPPSLPCGLQNDWVCTNPIRVAPSCYQPCKCLRCQDPGKLRCQTARASSPLTLRYLGHLSERDPKTRLHSGLVAPHCKEGGLLPGQWGSETLFLGKKRKHYGLSS